MDPKERRPDGFLRKFQLVHSNYGVPFTSAVTNLTVKNFSDRSMSRKCFSRGSPMPGYCEVRYEIVSTFKNLSLKQKGLLTEK